MANEVTLLPGFPEILPQADVTAPEHPNQDTIDRYAILRQNAVNSVSSDETTATERLRRNVANYPTSEPNTSNALTDVSTPTAEKAVASDKSNVLHRFASSTYGLSLHALTVETYNNLVNGGGYEPGTGATDEKGKTLNPKNVYVASAGRFKQNRNKQFENTDFFFDGLTMTTIIGAHAGTQNTNVTELSFKIIEPNGMSFIPRLISASREYKDLNYLNQPYLIQIDFFGYNDEGNIEGTLLSDISKRIPIRITKIDLVVTSKGTEYTVSAVAFNEVAVNRTSASVPINLSVTAGTVASFFPAADYIADTGVAKAIDTQRSYAREAINDPENVDSAARSTPQKNVRYSAKSFTGAINTWYSYLYETEFSECLDSISFEIDPVIGSALIVDPAQVDVSQTAMKRSFGTCSSEIGFQVNAGSTITELLSLIIRNSTYIRSQFASQGATENEIKNMLDKDVPTNWFKIIPVVRIVGYSKSESKFATHTTYHVVQHKIFNTKYPYIANGLPKSNVIAKTYDYLFTGKSRDIIDFKIELNNMYYTAVTAQPAKSQIDAVNNFPDPTVKTETQNAKGQAAIGATKDPNSVSPISTHTMDGSAANGIFQDGVQARVDDWNRILMSQADMVELNLKIVGDPQFIKQDGIFYRPKTAAEVQRDESQLTPNNSIETDYTEIFVNVNINTPSDYNETTGLLDAADTNRSSSNESVIGGIYRIYQVESVFSKGHFEQNLRTVRVNIPQSTKKREKELADTGSVADWYTDTDSSVVTVHTPATETKTPDIEHIDPTSVFNNSSGVSQSVNDSPTVPSSSSDAAITPPANDAFPNVTFGFKVEEDTMKRVVTGTIWKNR